MGTITIGGRQVAVDDAFHDLSPGARAAAVADIASRLAALDSAAAPAAAAPPLALARDRAPVDFDLHGARPIAPFGFGGPVRMPPQPAPEPAPGTRPAAAPVGDEVSHFGALPSPDWADVAKSAGVGILNGVVGTLGLPADLARLAGVAPSWADSFTQEGLKHGIEDHLFELYQPKTRAGRYAETISEFAPMILGGEGLAFARGARTLAAAGASLRNLGGDLVKHAVAPGLAVQYLEDSYPDSKAGPVLKKAYPWARRLSPPALAAWRALR